MLNAPTPIIITGPVGQLETIYLPAEGQVRGVAVINHPNPRQGGTFTNKVIQTAAKTYAKLGFHCYLPNLRGVGNSEGEHDYGRGETDDCLAVLDFAQAQHPDAKQVLLSGFSFGGYVAIHAAARKMPDVLVLLAPAIGMYPIEAPNVSSPERCLLIHGGQDEVVPLANTLQWATAQNLPLTVMPEASHFFHGRLIALRDLLLRQLPPFLEHHL